ncbi:ATP-binding cassette domain-containing protein [Pseudoroseicyclus sp. H15]
MIRLDDLTISRGEHKALDGISLGFGHGGITAVIGPNGAGKSTLLHAIAGLLPVTSGSVTVDGLDMLKSRPRDRARALALLTQSEQVTARLTVEELVSFGRWPHHQDRPREEDRAMVAEAIAAFDLGTLAGRSLSTLSGGQRQRAFVAMAYAQDTPWMLLDEPLSALDPRHARDIMDRLHELSRPGKRSRSVLIVLHDLGIAARYADRIVALKDGRLVTSGPRLLAFTGRMLSDVFETPLAVDSVKGQPVVLPG